MNKKLEQKRRYVYELMWGLFIASVCEPTPLTLSVHVHIKKTHAKQRKTTPHNTMDKAETGLICYSFPPERLATGEAGDS